ncbi:phagocyte signaling-impaired protein [Coccinella septempunctata]|uniref:phagocyte signaling-impaired protein n=1 Tax=Coccinella septempunctata TaxID=41139 RepID=UPI001D0860F5|nr:phagocyte signaling-impaired protein [Coccinella septempunctata]
MSKFHVQDSSVIERRLRPIYEWLDSGNNKKSLHECDKVLKKSPNLLCAKALKALTLLRIGKESDSIAVLDNLITECPTDEATLQAMTLCFRELQQVDRICKIYEAAVRQDPSNEELHTHLFMSYVRISDFKSQQRAAMALYKFKPKNPYYCWAVMSILLQATRGEDKNDPKKRNLLLSLAERMMDKLIAENKMDADQQVQLYIMILEQQKKYKEIIEVMDGPLGRKLSCTDIPLAKIPYFINLRRWSDVNLICKKILAESVDKWNVWKHYVNSVLELMSQNKIINNVDNHELKENNLDTIDDTPEKAHEFICGLVENGADNGFLLRGPYLARFELCSKLVDRGIDTTELLGETIELFVEYFRKFGHKPCCVTDLRSYLKLLDEDKKSDLSSRLLKDVGISATNIPKSEQQMQRHISALQLSRLCGSHRNLPDVHLKALVTAFSLHYQHGYQSYGTQLLPTDLGPSDPYALLAAHVMYDLAQMQKSAEPIIVALVLLEWLLKKSPSNFHAKLLCVRLYHTVGGAIGAQNMYDSLEIKHLQLDSLGYIHCARLPTTGLIGIATSHYDTTLKFFASNYKDSADHLTSSYKFGSFAKLEDFMDFRERLNHSLHYAAVTIDKIMLTFMCCLDLEALGCNLAQNLNPDWDLLRNNSDLNVYSNWDPERVEGPPEESEEIKTLFEQDVDFLKLRAQVVYATITALEIAKATTGIQEAQLDKLERIVEEWGDLEKCVRKKDYKPFSRDRITLPLPSRIHCALECPYQTILGNLFKFLVGLVKQEKEIYDELLTVIKTELNNLIENVDSMIKQTVDFLQLRTTMEFVVNNVEIVCIACIIYDMCNDLVKPRQSKKGKKNHIVETKEREAVLDLAEALKTTTKKFDTILHLWSTVSTQTDIVSELESLNLNNCGNEVFQTILSSHIQAVTELRLIIKTKSGLIILYGGE